MCGDPNLSNLTWGGRPLAHGGIHVTLIPIRRHIFCPHSIVRHPPPKMLQNWCLNNRRCYVFWLERDGGRHSHTQGQEQHEFRLTHVVILTAGPMGGNFCSVLIRFSEGTALRGGVKSKRFNMNGNIITHLLPIPIHYPLNRMMIKKFLCVESFQVNLTFGWRLC